ncbi:hypothetical protein ARAM_006323 [Aspergillus rambellii]|uniref:Cryptococcal mannosyltransferase 1-domain-containing protein n=1 Tax=Aspergillus rambellii TaxID=308745 RepID=A0A0F8WN26_9EURO|nr:hypothetical protein ARAM_006323 [Aspergillus rambellii]
MSSRLLHPDEYELDARSSIDSQGTFNLDEADFESQSIPRPRRLLHKVPLLSRFFTSPYSGYRRLKPSRPRLLLSGWKRPNCYRRLLLRRACLYLHAIGGIILALVVLTSIFRPSYTRPPAHYRTLQDSISKSTTSGRGNPRNEKIFIAASLYDRSGDLAGGQWGERVLQLVDLLGEENVYLSIYENDSGTAGAGALVELEAKVKCNKSIVFEDQLDLNTLQVVTVPGGSKRIKRIEYLAEVRNRALRPLDDHPEMRFDKLLYLNDVIFNPIDAVQLLFSTNVDENGIARYRAACAVDFINPFKFYDTYATRDLQGYGPESEDVLSGTDAVRVRSCWGGMVAFDARFFQLPTSGPAEQHPARFRASQDTFWEASECCLIHADIQPAAFNVEEITDSGIYMNPFIRVAYDSRTLSWLGTTRRFEKLYSFIHNLGNHLVGLPWFNPRRTEVPGQTVTENVWVPNENESEGGSFQDIERVAANDGFCGRRGLQVIVEHRQEGQKGWESIPIPS